MSSKCQPSLQDDVPPIQFYFDEEKAAQSAAYLIRKTGKTAINYMLLVKLLYLTDRKLLIDRGKPLTGDGFAALPKGPVVSTICNFVRGQRDGETWSQYVVKNGRYDVAIDHETPDSVSRLSPSELDALDDVFSDYGHLDPFAVVEQLHIKSDFPEWDDPKGSSFQIDPKDILLQNGWTVEDAREIAALAQTDRHYRAG